MCVIVPVTERSRSPSISETPTAPPGRRSGSGSRAGAPRCAAAHHRARSPGRRRRRAPSRRWTGRSREKTRGRASGVSAAPASSGAGPAQGPRVAGTAGQRPAQGGHRAPRGRGARPGPRRRTAREARRGRARGSAVRVASIISPIGVMPRDRLLREREAVGDRAHELAVDEDGAAAHAGDHAGLRERPALEAGQDHALLGPDVLEHADDLDPELLDRVPSNTVRPTPDHAGPDLVRAAGSRRRARAAAAASTATAQAQVRTTQRHAQPG